MWFPISHLCNSKLSLIIQEVLHVAGVEMQLTAAGSFLTILQEESVSIHTYAHSFLQIILLHLEHRDTGQGPGALNYILIYCFFNVVMMFFEPFFSLMSITEWGHAVQELIISLTKNSHGCFLQNLKNSVFESCRPISSPYDLHCLLWFLKFYIVW